MHQLQTPYLRSLRRRWALTQTELAFLAGLGSNVVVCHIENARRTPQLAAAFACELIFGMTLTDIFAVPHSAIAKGVLERARILYDDVQGRPGKETKLKLDFLEMVFARLDEDDLYQV